MIDKEIVKKDLDGITGDVERLVVELKSHINEIKEFRSKLDNLSDDEIRRTVLALDSKIKDILGD
jgi:predicted ribonuclease toxin of YeeF-YezG toxin-antitoxin module